MKSKKTLVLLLLGNSAFLISLYFLLVSFEILTVTPIYVALAAVLGFAFIIYNRGFAAKNATPDQLPDTMTEEEKLAFIQEGKDRLARSRWMLTLIFPLILAIAIDLAGLFILPYLKELLS